MWTALPDLVPHIRFLFVRLAVCYRLPSSIRCLLDSAELLVLPATGRTVDFHHIITRALPGAPLKPQLPAPTLAEGSVILSAQEAEALLTFIYYVRFLFADVFGKLDGLLRIVDSPLAGSFWDAFHEVSWGRILEILAKHGHDINDMPCYQHWSSCQPKRKAA